MKGSSVSTVMGHPRFETFKGRKELRAQLKRPPQPGRQPQGDIAKDIPELMPSVQPNGEGAHRNSIHDVHSIQVACDTGDEVAAVFSRWLYLHPIPGTSGEAGLSPKQRKRWRTTCVQ